MAKKTIVTLVDDLTGEDIADGKGETVSFSLDGKSYEVDLTKKNADKFRGLFQDYIAVASKTGRKTRTTQYNSKTNTAEIRAWAKQQGMDVPDRGRLPKEVQEAWDSK